MRIAVTLKQKAILDLMRDGKSQQFIAKQLNCSPANVCQVVKTIQRKYPELKLWREKINIKETFDLGSELNN